MNFITLLSDIHDNTSNYILHLLLFISCAGINNIKSELSLFNKMHVLKCSFLILFAFTFLKDTQGTRIINSIVAKNKTEVTGEDKNKDIIAHLIGEIDALKERVGDLEKYRKLAENEESGIIENHYTGQEFLPGSCKYEI